MHKVSMYTSIAFALITVATVYQFYRASNSSKIVVALISVWMLVQFGIGQTDFYANGYTMPPRFLLMVVPPLIVIISLFVTTQGKVFIANLSLAHLTLLHTVRVLVEVVLYYLFVAKTIPQIMTFEGANFDILAGLTAPIVYYLTFVKRVFTTKLLLVWNIISTCLLLTIVVLAILSAQTPVQQFGFTQPNIAITHFPFNWLPSVVVPLVLLSHLAAMQQLISGTKTDRL